MTAVASDPANDVQEEYIVTATDSTLAVYIGGEEKYRETIAIGQEVPFTDLAKRSCKVRDSKFLQNYPCVCFVVFLMKFL